MSKRQWWGEFLNSSNDDKSARQCKAKFVSNLPHKEIQFDIVDKVTKDIHGKLHGWYAQYSYGDISIQSRENQGADGYTIMYYRIPVFQLSSELDKITMRVSKETNTGSHEFNRKYHDERMNPTIKKVLLDHVYPVLATMDQRLSKELFHRCAGNYWVTISEVAARSDTEFSKKFHSDCISHHSSHLYSAALGTDKECTAMIIQLQANARAVLGLAPEDILITQTAEGKVTGEAPEPPSFLD